MLMSTKEYIEKVVKTAKASIRYKWLLDARLDESLESCHFKRNE